MTQLTLFKEEQDPRGTLICRMTITLKNGRVIRRANGKPFCFYVK